MFYKVKEVEPFPEYILLVKFNDDTKKIYDLKPLIEKSEYFKELYFSQDLFKQVKVDVGGYGVYWNDNLDLSCNELWNNSEYINEE